MSFRIISRILFLIPACLVLFGCEEGGGGITVTGNVTFNGKPVEDGQITFYPVDGKGSPVGGTIKGGKYKASNVPSGKAKVIVQNTNTSGPVASSMGDAVKDKSKKDTSGDIQPNDEGNSQSHDISSGTLDITIRTSSSSAPKK